MQTNKKLVLSSMTAMAASTMAAIGDIFSEDRNPARFKTNIDRNGLSATKRYANGIKKIHNKTGSRFRSAVQIREKAVGVHWLKA